MKIQYFGDRHDWRKYRLISRMIDAGFSVGLFWMLTPPDKRSDGNHEIISSDTDRLTEHEKQIYNFLQGFRGGSSSYGERKDAFEKFQNQNVLKVQSFFDQEMLVGGQGREAQIENAIENFSSVDLVFFDPDNGVEVSSVPYKRSNSVKYLYLKEIRRFWDAGKSIVIYQHKSRVSLDKLIEQKRRILEIEIPNLTEIKFVSLPNVIFIFLMNSKHDFLKAKEQIENMNLPNLRII
jgi:hypothetical protein